MEPFWLRSGSMPSLTLKNIPEDLLADLREDARQDQRSLNQQALYLIRIAMQLKARRVPTEGDKAEAQNQALRKLAGQWHSEDPQREIAEIYAARTQGRKVDFP